MPCADWRKKPEECSARSTRRCWNDCRDPPSLLPAFRAPFATAVTLPALSVRRMQNRSASPVSYALRTSASVVRTRDIRFVRLGAYSRLSQGRIQAEQAERLPQAPESKG